MKNLFVFLFISILVISFNSCKKDVVGCTDSLSDNYNAEATTDDGSCTFQKRFLGKYSGEFKCTGSFANVFSMADMEIIELIKKDEVNIIIQTAIGPLPVMGVLTRDSVKIDATLKNLKIRAGDILPAGGDLQVLADGKIKSALAISNDNKVLTGKINLELIVQENIVIGIFPVPKGFSLADNCDFKGTKK